MVTTKRDSRHASSAGRTAADVDLNLLRRVDWRFLLDQPVPRRAVILPTASPRIAAALRLLGTETLEQREMDCGGRCDLAVAGDWTDETIRSASRSLKPGGVLYLEVWGVGMGERARVHRALLAGGYELIGEYLPQPGFARGAQTAWMRLGGYGAIRHRFLGLPRGSGIRSRLSRGVRALVWRLRARGWLPADVSVIARRCGTTELVTATRGRAGMKDPEARRSADLLELVREECRRHGLAESPDRCSLLLLTPGKQPVNKIVGVVFQEPDPQPLLVVKLPRISESIPGLQNEVEVLRTLRARAAAPIVGVPEILFTFRHGGYPVVGQSFVAGRPLSALLNRNSARSLALKSTNWLIAFANRGAAASGSRRPHPLVATILAEFSDRFESVVDRSLLEATEDLMGTLGDLPVTCEQRDFSPWNLRVDEAGDLGVLDWESAIVAGLPLLDLLYFLAYLSFYVDGAQSSQQKVRSLRGVSDPNSRMGSISLECVEKYSSGVGIPPSSVAPLRVLLWMVHSRSEFRQVCRDAGAVPDAATLRAGLFVRLWEDEVRRVLEQ